MKKGRRKLNYYEEASKEVEPEERSSRSELWDNFISISYAISAPSIQPRKLQESCEDYTEVFLCHVQLYVFAEKYDIDPLRRLSLHKLQRTLAGYTLYDERVGDVVELIRYSYSNTTDHSGHTDDLRSLVTHYAACMIEDLARRAEFRSLLQEAGSFAGDLVVRMLDRLD